MTTAVAVIWAIGLVAALALTAVVLKLLFLLLRTLGDLRELAEWTAEAADGLARVFSGSLGLQESADAAEGLHSGAAALHASATRVRKAVGAPAPDARDGKRKPEGAAGAGQLGGAAGGPASGPGGGS